MSLNPKNYTQLSKSFLLANYFSKDFKTSTLIFYSGTFYHWDGKMYSPQDKNVLKSKIRKFFVHITDTNKEPFRVTKHFISEVLEALIAEVIVSTSLKAPFFRNNNEERKQDNYISFSNGLLDLSLWRMTPHTPDYINFSSVPHPYLDSCDEPVALSKFLNSVWPADPESIYAIQEWIGLILTSITSYQKALMIIGPPRSGKGTLGRLISLLIGTENITSPTMSGLGQHFGLASLINKNVAIISDARFNERSPNVNAFVENVLRITGEDSISIPRKNKEDYEGRLICRLLLFSNELPLFNDASNAVSNRFIVLHMKNSFLGNEDIDLDKKLSAEVNQIISWGTKGLRRLINRGYLVQPKSSLSLMDQLGELTSPIQSFVETECEIGLEHSISKKVLFQKWSNWCVENNIRNYGSSAIFGKMLRARYTEVSDFQKGSGKHRQWFYSGIVHNDIESTSDLSIY